MSKNREFVEMGDHTNRLYLVGCFFPETLSEIVRAVFKERRFAKEKEAL